MSNKLAKILLYINLANAIIVLADRVLEKSTTVRKILDRRKGTQFGFGNK